MSNPDKYPADKTAEGMKELGKLTTMNGKLGITNTPFAKRLKNLWKGTVSTNELSDMFPDNKLTLEILAEEASEIIQAKSKIIRFGLQDTYNDTSKPDQTNREKLEEEIGHFLAVVDVLTAKGIVRPEKIKEAKPIKWQKMYRWNQYKGTKGDF